MTSAELLSHARRRAGLTQAELAARAGTSQPVISAYERERRDPTVSTLRRLLVAAGARLELRAPSVAAADPGTALLGPAADQSAQLVDVLLLADAIPFRRRGDLAFPRISSS